MVSILMIEIPTHCPCCDSELERVNMQLFCRNTECGDRVIHQIESYCKKRKIKGLATKSIEKLELTGIADIYSLEEDYLVETLGKNGSKIYAEIQHSLNTSLANLLGSLSIPLIGQTTASKITGISIRDLDYSKLPEKASANFEKFLSTNLYKELCEIPFSLEIVESVKSGIKVCLSGRFSKPKALIKAELEQQGYMVTENLTKDVEILFVADKSITSTKTKKATQLNIIIEELK